MTFTPEHIQTMWAMQRIDDKRRDLYEDMALTPSNRIYDSVREQFADEIDALTVEYETLTEELRRHETEAP